jgi:hypothetical protein
VYQVSAASSLLRGHRRLSLFTNVAQDDRKLNPGQVAAYVAKYSCKASHEQITTRDTDR